MVLADPTTDSNAGGAATNNRSFDLTAVDGDGDSIMLDNPALSGTGVDFALVGSTFELGQAVVYDAGGGTPIGGLVHGGTYYIIASTNQFNLQGDLRLVDEQVVQLAETEAEALAGVAIDIDPSVATQVAQHQLRAKHIIDSGRTTGLGIQANLSSSDSVSSNAGFEVEEDPQGDPPPDDETGYDNDQSIFENLFNSLTADYSANSNAGGGGASSSLQLAAAVTFFKADHDVNAIVRSPADLQSNEDLEVIATISEEIKLEAESKVTTAEDDGASNSAISAAIIVGLFDNTAKATVESGAQLDALRATRVISDITYPLLKRPDEFIPTNLGELIDGLKEKSTLTGLAGVVAKKGEGLSDFLKKALGLDNSLSDLFNTWAKASGKAGGTSISGAVNFLMFTNVSEAIVQSGVQINQDLNFRDPQQNSHANNTGQQVVSIEATNYAQLINVTGFFDFDIASLNINAVGTESTEGGVGGSIFIALINNTTTSLVESGAAVFSGQSGGFNMKAEEAMFSGSFAQAGANSGSYAIGGTFSYFEQNSNNLAHLDSGAIVTGRNAVVYAGNLETQANWAGGVATGESVGAGIAVAVNQVNRRTRALIGEEDDDPANQINIDVTDGVQTLAMVSGDVWSFTIAGAEVGEEESDDSGGGSTPEATDPLAGVDTSAAFDSSSTSQQNQAQTGIGIAAAASVNLIEDETTSRIVDAGQINAGYITADAENAVSVVAATGGLATVSGDSGDTSAALAGAFSYNELTATTVAEVRYASLFLTGNSAGSDVLGINAVASGNVFAASAGGAGSEASGNSGDGTSGSGSTAISIAGSVSVNTIGGETTAALRDSIVNLETGNVIVRSEDGADILAFAGGLSLATASGDQGSSTAAAAGVAISVNKLSTSAQALVENANVSWADGAVGDLQVEAVNSRSIGAFTIGGAVSAASGSQGSGAAGAAQISKVLAPLAVSASITLVAAPPVPTRPPLSTIPF